MIIDVSRLQNDVGAQLELSFPYEPPATELDNDVRIARPVAVHIKLVSGRNEIWLTGELNIDAEFTCDRCLKKYKTHLGTRYTELYRHGSSKAAPGEDDDGELRTVYYHGTEIDITEGVRQNLLLVLPTKHLCSESCKGLCPTCGHDFNEGPCNCTHDEIDPRFEILKKLRLNDSDEGSVD